MTFYASHMGSLMVNEERSASASASAAEPLRPHETSAERSDRNWSELLQELRVMQTGVQVLTGFLLTLPFQQRFAELDPYQRTLYLCLVTLSVATTGILIAPVAIHRALFHRGLKSPLVRTTDRLAHAGLAMLGLVITGTVTLAFDIVVSRAAGITVGLCAIALLTGLWVVLPHWLGKRSVARTPAS